MGDKDKGTKKPVRRPDSSKDPKKVTKGNTGVNKDKSRKS